MFSVDPVKNPATYYGEIEGLTPYQLKLFLESNCTSREVLHACQPFTKCCHVYSPPIQTFTMGNH